jgi:hypothetical protein
MPRDSSQHKLSAYPLKNIYNQYFGGYHTKCSETFPKRPFIPGAEVKVGVDAKL